MGLGVLAAAAVIGLPLWLFAAHTMPNVRQQATGVGGVANTVATNPNVDTGANLRGVRAPQFTLTNQFGQPATLQQFRGKVVLLAFVDSQCTTICPLTTASMMDAVRSLGPAAAAHVQLIGVNANPIATSVGDVRAYSVAHGMMFHWQFLTGSKKALARVWSAYHMYAAVVHGQVDHTPGLFLIGQHGRERRLYMTQMAFAGVSAQGQIMARAISALLPTGLAKQTHVALPTLLPTLPATLPLAEPTRARKAVALAGHAHLLVFFATWLGQLQNLSGPLAAVEQYASAAERLHLPSPVLIDELPTEPSAAALTSFLHGAGAKTAGVTAVDASGEAADAVGVQGLPWYSVVSAKGKVLWSHTGWLPAHVLQRVVQRALHKAP